jgi:hypothetical protein
VDWNSLFVSSHEENAATLDSFFHNLLGSSINCSWNFNVASLYPDNVALPDSLSSPISLNEINEALACMNESSSPGPDGFGPSFYYTFWDIVSSNVKTIFSDFFNGTISKNLARIYIFIKP